MLILMKISKDTSYASTSFWGDTIFTSALKLTKLFGESEIGDPDKVKYEWDLVLDEIPFAIYDWKMPELEFEDYIDYHIGARNKEESTKIKESLNKILNNEWS